MAGVSQTNSSNTADADGVTTVFNFTFFAYSTDTVKVYSVLNDVLTPITTGITIDINSSFIGGTVTFSVAPADAVGDILIRREVPNTQEVEFADLTRRKESSIEEALNTIVLQIQQVQADVDRALKYSELGGTSDTTLEKPVEDRVLVFEGTTGRVKAGSTTANLDTLAALTSEIAALAAITADITTAAGISGDITTVAGDSADIKTLADINADIQILADIEDGTDATDAIQSVAAISANITTVASNMVSIVQAAEAVASALAFTFDNSTSMADPGTGELRLNNAALASVTAAAIDAVTAQSGNPDLSDFIATWDDSTNPSNKGYIRVTKGGAPENFAIYEIDSVTDNTGWLQIGLTHIDSNGSFSNTDTLYLTFTRTGDQGSVSVSGNNNFTGNNTFAGKTAYKDDGELTIASGAITITGTDHTVDTQSDAATDDLDTINGGTDGEILIIRAANGARDVVVKHGTGNITTPDGNDITLDDTSKSVILKYDAELADWLVLSAPSAGGGQWELLRETEVTSLTEIQILDLQALIDEYDIDIQAALTTGGSSSSSNNMQVSTNNGTSWVTTNVYEWSFHEYNPGSAPANQSSSSQSSIQIRNGSSFDLSFKRVLREQDRNFGSWIVTQFFEFGGPMWFGLADAGQSGVDAIRLNFGTAVTGGIQIWGRKRKL